MRMTRAEQEEAEFGLFLKNVARPALEEVQEKLKEEGIKTDIYGGAVGIVLTVTRNGVEDMSFRIYNFSLPGKIFPYLEIKAKESGSLKISRTEAPIKSFTEGQTIADITQQDVVDAFFKYFKD